MAIPNLVQTANQSEERIEGEIAEQEVLALNLADEDIQRIIGRRVENSEKYWNEKLKLDDVRENVEKYYLNDTVDESELYDFQIAYKDNRSFIAIETLLPMVLSKPPQPIVVEAQNTEASQELARNLQKVLLGKYEDLYLKARFQMVIRHLLVGYRLGVMKYRWDTTIGSLQPDGSRFGDIAVSTLRPQRIVLDEGANDQDDVPLIGEYCTNTVEYLTVKFPNKKDDIWRELGITRGTGSQMSKRVGYLEVWFSHYEAAEKKEAVAWKMGKTVLGSMKNPNWNYDEPGKDAEGGMIYNNFFDRPMKPYILFNFLNLGKHVIDDTSLTDQAMSQQDILNKRGRQIVENADQANSGTVFNEDMINQETAAKLIGDPGEKAMVKGNVNNAAMRLPQNLLPNYVIEDKIDARNEIQSIYGANAPLSGQKTNSPTLGQEVLSQRADLSRTLTLATSVEDGADRLNKAIVQMMKVFYDADQTVQFTGSDGKTSFLQIGQNKIETGVKVRIKTGSVLPDDPIAKEEQTLKALAILDPLSIGEGLNKDDPKEFAKRLMLFRLAPDKYMSDILGEDINSSSTQDPSAIQEQQVMSQGKEVPPQQNPTKAHLATHQVFIESPEFKQLDPQIQSMVLTHVKAENEIAKQQLGMQSEQPPAEGAVPPEATAAPTETENPVAAPPPSGVSGIVKGIIDRVRGR